MNRHPYVDICKKNISGHFQAISGQNRPGSGRNSKITSEMDFAHPNTYESTPICRYLPKKYFRPFSGSFRPKSAWIRPKLKNNLGNGLCAPKYLRIDAHLSIFAKKIFQAVSGQNRPELGRKSKITSEMDFAHPNTYESTPICRYLQKKYFRQFQAKICLNSAWIRPNVKSSPRNGLSAPKYLGFDTHMSNV